MQPTQLCCWIIFATIAYAAPIEVKYFGDECDYDEQCTDYRLLCEISGHDSIRRCACDGIHRWEEDFQACVPKYNSTFLLTLLQPRRDTAGLIAKEAKQIFIGAAIAGWIVIITVVFLCIAVLIFCRQTRRSDRHLKFVVEGMKKRAQRAAPSRSI